MSQNRRSFLATLGGATLGLAYGGRSLGALVSAPEQRAKLSRIGIQLYTLRHKAETDLAGTLGQLAKIGYKEIEFAGYYNHPATEVREILEKNGLTAPSAHLRDRPARERRGRPNLCRREDGWPRMAHGPVAAGQTGDRRRLESRRSDRFNYGGDRGKVGRISVRVSQP